MVGNIVFLFSHVLKKFHFLSSQTVINLPFSSNTKDLSHALCAVGRFEAGKDIINLPFACLYQQSQFMFLFFLSFFYVLNDTKR